MRRCVCLIACGIWLTPALASNDDLLSLSLEDLLKVEVSVAARRSESWLGAAGTVYVVTRADIERYGWRDMREILQSIPNMDYFYQWGWLPGGQRGFTGNLSSTLLLIDGREVQNLLANEAMMNNNFPAARIERVEVLQGPNSTLYGANAAQGVINIITRHAQADADPLTEIGLLAGEVKTRQGSLMHRRRYGEWQVGLFASHFSSDLNFPEVGRFLADDERYSRTPALDRVRDHDPNHFRNDETSWVLDGIARWRQFYAGFNATGVDNLSGIERPKPDYTGVVARRGYQNWFAGYDWGGHQGWSGNVEVSQFRERKEADRQRILNLGTATSYEDLQIVVQQEDITPSFRWRLRGHATYRSESDSEWIIGYDGWRQDMGSRVLYTVDANGNRQSAVTTGWPSSKEDASQHAWYLQYARRWALPEGWGESFNLTAGLRHHQQDFTESAWLPRLSTVYQPDRNSAWKLTFGKAFRPPTIFEFEGVVTDSLESQYMTMLELAYARQWQWGGWLLSGNAALYQMHSENFYEKVFNTQRQVWETRVTGTQDVSGFETQLNAQRGRWHWQAGFRQARPDTTLIGSEPYRIDVPPHKLKLGLAYEFENGWKLSGFADAWAHTITRAVTVQGSGVEPYRIPGWVVLNGYLRSPAFTLGEATAEVGLYVENLFDKAYTHPNARGTAPVQYPQAPRNLRLQATLRF